jgi:hypothetical protein
MAISSSATESSRRGEGWSDGSLVGLPSRTVSTSSLSSDAKVWCEESVPADARADWIRLVRDELSDVVRPADADEDEKGRPEFDPSGKAKDPRRVRRSGLGMLSKAEWAAGSMARPKEGRFRWASTDPEESGRGVGRVEMGAAAAKVGTKTEASVVRTLLSPLSEEERFSEGGSSKCAEIAAREGDE